MLHVLIAEDHDDCAQSMATLLRLNGHEVQIAEDGPAALAAARGGWPDVILLDIALPGMDGWQVAQGIEAWPREKRPLLVAVTGYGREADRRRSAESGIDIHLVKPVDPEQLLGLLGKFRALLD